MAAIVFHRQRYRGRRGVPLFAMDRLDIKGLRRFTLNQGTLVETLIQLSEFRQYEMAESVLVTCDKEQLSQLLTVSDRAFSARLTYSLEKQWQRSQHAAYEVKKSPLTALVNIVNTWCAEGRRTAIRCVAGQMREIDLLALMQQDTLDREVYSMLREYVFQ
jgi:hypothetical protein